MLGGYSTLKRQLEPVIDAACKWGLADDGEAVTFPAAVGNPKRLRRIVKNSIIAGHSAGNMNVTPDMDPDYFIACMPPEPCSVRGLLRAGNQKVKHGVRQVLRGPERGAHARLLRDGYLASLGYLPVHIAQLPRVSRFSARQILTAARDAGIGVGRVEATDDVFFPTQHTAHLPEGAESMLVPGSAEQGVPTVLIRGTHDEPLLHASFVIDAVRTHINPARVLE